MRSVLNNSIYRVTTKKTNSFMGLQGKSNLNFCWMCEGWLGREQKEFEAALPWPAHFDFWFFCLSNGNTDSPGKAPRGLKPLQEKSPETQPLLSSAQKAWLRVLVGEWGRGEDHGVGALSTPLHWSANPTGKHQDIPLPTPNPVSIRPYYRTKQ